MSSIAKATKIVTDIAKLLGAGVLLTKAVKAVSAELGISQKEVRRIWREYGPPRLM